MRQSMKRSMIVLVAMLIVPVLFIGQVSANPTLQQDFTPRDLDVRLNGSGATFPEPVYQRLIKDYKDVNPNVKINYQGVGSGQGIADFTGGVTDFGGTDAVVSSDEFTGDELHVPMVMGPVVATYNLDIGKKSLQFTGDVLERIFRGDITSWKHEDIVSIQSETVQERLNNLTDDNITVVVRSDSSGTSSIFTTYLEAINDAWTATKKFETDNGTILADGMNIVAQPKNNGVASKVKETPGAIGYVEFIYAKTNRLPTPRIKNNHADGKFIRPSLQSTVRAAANQDYPTDLRMDIVNNTNDQYAYPIAGFTWLLVHETGYTDLVKAQAVTDYVCWALQPEQQTTQKRMGYASLPGDARAKSIEQIKKVTVDGTKAFEGECP